MKNYYNNLSKPIVLCLLCIVGVLLLVYVLYLVSKKTKNEGFAAQCVTPYKPDQPSVETEVVEPPTIPVCPAPTPVEPIKPIPVTPTQKAKTEYVCQCPDCDAKCPYNFPDLSKYVLKSSIPPCPATPDLSKYILKTDVPKCVSIDKSKYILRSEVPDCICPDCPACNCSVPDIKICTDMINGNSTSGGESVETEVEVENRGSNAGGLTPSISVVTDYIGSADGGADNDADATIYVKGFQGGGGNFGGVDDNFLILQEK